jgi:hypothetical protein
MDMHMAAKPTNGGQGIRPRRRRTKAILKEGLEAALRANLELLEKCKPKTGLGGIIRGMVVEASKSKTTPLRQVMALLEWEGVEDASEFVDETDWDWSPEGVWETMPEEEPERGEPVADKEGPAKKELRRRIDRLIEVGDHEPEASIIHPMRTPANGEPPPAVAAPPP